MGAGRRTETVNYNDGHQLGAGGSNVRAAAPQRRLAERNRLGSVIFGCTPITYNECVTNKIFGLPYSHHTYVEHIVPGMPLFLFNYSEKKMHGIFEAVSEGALNISPYAWTGAEGAVRTQFPSQVRVQLRPDFGRIVALSENVFKETLIDNYHTPTHFFFEVDIEQTDKLVKLFERAAGSALRPLVPRVPSTAWQTVTPKVVWNKKTSGTGESDDKLKLKKPESVVMSEWERGAQYFPSSGEVKVDDQVGPQHEPVWSLKSSNAEEDNSDDSEDLQPSYKVPDVTSEAEMRRTLGNEKQEPDHRGLLMKSAANGYRPKLNGISEPSTSQEGHSDETDLTIAQNEVKSRAFERLQLIATEAQQSQGPQVQAPREVMSILRNATSEMTEWEKMSRDRSDEEQHRLKEEREKLGTTLSYLDSSVAMTVQTNLALYANAIEQIRHDGMELRRLLDEARIRPEELDRLSAVEISHAAMAAEIQALKLEVADLRRQIVHSGIQEKVQETEGTPLKPPDNATPPDIYLIGGLGDQLSRLESVMVWSPVTDRLRTAAPMLTPRCCAGASVLDGSIYVFGGGDGSSWYDTVEKYDRRVDQWLPCAPMKTKRGSLGGVTVGDRIFAVGGGNGQVSFSDVESYDPYLGTWLQCTPMFEKRFCVAATEFEGLLYCLGGFDGEQYLMSMECFDPREALWTRMPSMSVRRGSLSAAVLNGRIYALGGYDGDGILDVVETFDPRAGRWHTGPQMCCQRAYGAVAVVGESLYYMGGLAEDEAVDSIQRYTEATGWQSMRPRVIGKRSCLAAVVF